MGSTSRRANSRAVSWMARCSSVREKYTVFLSSKAPKRPGEACYHYRPSHPSGEAGEQPKTWVQSVPGRLIVLPRSSGQGPLDFEGETFIYNSTNTGTPFFPGGPLP